MNYSDTVKAAYERCGGKSKPKFGDIREFAGHLSVVLAENDKAHNSFMKNGRRRAKTNGKTTAVDKKEKS